MHFISFGFMRFHRNGVAGINTEMSTPKQTVHRVVYLEVRDTVSLLQ